MLVFVSVLVNLIGLEGAYCSYYDLKGIFCLVKKRKVLALAFFICTELVVKLEE